ncbi:TetR/AcrR family transcriptional regulator [Paenibacillus sp. 1P07SE]|uniref:TetR/AcrR family transcriptional regulator n=1 Tax=Paenibacillus sp. 1P07SE TaxID=3132209 RepID=UPI0039A453EC
MDRRIARSRQAIMEAFVGLMKEMEFEKMTIQAIADQADVNRGTVYLHFTDKYDLLEQCVETYLQLLVNSCTPDGGPEAELSRDLLLRTFEYLEQHAAIYTILLTNKGIPAFRNRMTAIIQTNMAVVVDRLDLDTSIGKDVLAQFLSVAVVGLLEWWVVESMPYTPAQMVDQMTKIMEANLRLWPVSVDMAHTKQRLPQT